MRNPRWHRDEIILALDLYFSSDRGSIDVKNPKIIELSKILNALPLFTERPDAEKFRNPNGVALKLSNFMSFDPEYKGKGMSSASKLDKKVFDEFNHFRDKLKSVASEIRSVSQNSDIKAKISTIEEDESENVEGQILYKLHKVRERDVSIVREKKNQVLAMFGKINCEACAFDFTEFYGDIGIGFIECHHRTPLSSLKVECKTMLEDLALVCSNCHRMLHRKIDSLTVEQLKSMIKYERVLVSK